MAESRQTEVAAEAGVASRRTRFSIGVRELLHWIEVLIAFAAVIIVVVGAARLAGVVAQAARPETMQEFSLSFEEILSALLLLVVGVELAIMLVLRRPESLVEIMFFVIARKVLIKTDHVYELLLAVVAIGGLFAIQKYLMKGGRSLFGMGSRTEPRVDSE